MGERENKLQDRVRAIMPKLTRSQFEEITGYIKAGDLNAAEFMVGYLEKNFEEAGF